MRKLLAALALSLTLGGCATFNAFEQKVKAAASAVEGATVSPQAVIISASAYDALEALAKNYIDPRLNKRCDGTNGPICRNPDATVELNKAIRSGRVARNNAKQFLRDHPGQLGPQGLFDALEAARATLKDVFVKYGINTGGL